MQMLMFMLDSGKMSSSMDVGHSPGLTIGNMLESKKIAKNTGKGHTPVLMVRNKLESGKMVTSMGKGRSPIKVVKMPRKNGKNLNIDSIKFIMGWDLEQNPNGRGGVSVKNNDSSDTFSRQHRTMSDSTAGLDGSRVLISLISHIVRDNETIHLDGHNNTPRESATNKNTRDNYNTYFSSSA